MSEKERECVFVLERERDHKMRIQDEKIKIQREMGGGFKMKKLGKNESPINKALLHLPLIDINTTPTVD